MLLCRASRARELYYKISLILWAPFSLKTLLLKSAPVRAKHVRRTVEVAGKLLRIRRSQKQRDRYWPLIGHKISFFFFNHRHKHSNKSWNDSLRVASQGLSQLFLKIFAAVFPDSTGSPRMGIIR